MRCVEFYVKLINMFKRVIHDLSVFSNDMNSLNDNFYAAAATIPRKRTFE